MVFTVQLNTCGVDWHEVTELLRLAGIAYYADNVHQQAFNRSHAVIFVFHAGKLVGYCASCHVILYASPGKEPFYEKSHFRRLKTGMALFVNAERMQEKGFIH